MTVTDSLPWGSMLVPRGIGAPFRVAPFLRMECEVFLGGTQSLKARHTIVPFGVPRI